MGEDRIHRCTSNDGTRIAGRVHGQGPPLVLLPGGFADGETAWASLLPHLTEQLTCYTMSLRGRGLSESADDLSPRRLVEDVTSFVESIGEPSGIMGLSSGALFALGGAEHTDAASAVVAYEPPVFDIMSEEVSETFNGRISRVAELAAAGQPIDGVRTFIDLFTTGDELSTLSAQGDAFFQALARNIPVQLEEAKQFATYDGPVPTDAEELSRITAPVLLLHGTASEPHPWMADSVSHVAEHVPDARRREITGAGHLAPILEPEPVADEVRRFLAEVAAA